MADVLNKDTKQYLRSVNTVQYLDGNWLINPDLSAVQGFAPQYWKVVSAGDPPVYTVELMTEAERDAVDAAAAEARKSSTSAVMDQTDSYDRAFARILMDELNAHADRYNALRSAILSGATLAEIKSNITSSAAAAPTRTLAQLKTALESKLGT